MPEITLTGRSLTPEQLHQIALGDCKVLLDRDATDRIMAARRCVEQAVQDRVPVYGVTTGLGARATEALDAETLSGFSYQTLRGRAHAVGPPTPAEHVRAALAVRLNSMTLGASSVSPDLAHFLGDFLNAGLTPVVGETGSIGAGDLVWNATCALALIGEGEIRDRTGSVGPAIEKMQAHGLEPPKLGPRDGLALANHASLSAGSAAFALVQAEHALSTTQAAAALTLEGFRANLTAFDPRVLNLRPQPGQAEVAAQILAFLEGSSALGPGKARRLQDPLSLRNIPQTHGAARAALDFLREAVEPEINGASDNPVTLYKDEEIISAGAYHTPHLTNALETVSRAFAQMSLLQIARLSKLLSEKFSGLPLFLAEPGSGSNGFAPVMKTAEATLAELLHKSQPVPLWPSVNADGVEDSLTNTPLASQNLMNVADHQQRLNAIEMTMAARAVELAVGKSSVAPSSAPFLQKLHGFIRSVSPADRNDRPLGKEIQSLTNSIKTEEFMQLLQEYHAP